jgi:hypothetical protein
MKGEIQPDHIPVNKFQFRVAGLFDLAPVTCSGLEEELNVVDLPDRTRASGGQKNPTEFEIGIPMHHTVQMAALELWLKESSDPVLPTYKKPCTLVFTSISGRGGRNYTLVGVFPRKRALPDLDKANDGEMAVAMWTMSVDYIIPL